MGLYKLGLPHCSFMSSSKYIIRAVGIVSGEMVYIQRTRVFNETGNRLKKPSMCV